MEERQAIVILNENPLLVTGLPEDATDVKIKAQR
jgi:hypothetical protein